MTRTVAIIQARFASTRLPGKIMLSLGNSTVLAEVIARCLQVVGVDEVCCAVAEGIASDVIAAEARKSGASVFVGAGDDVLARYIGAARMSRADVILRVTSDCPLIDPGVCSDVIAVRSRFDLDYATNNLPPGFPHGLDCEAFSRDALEDAFEKAALPADREHVTPFLRRESCFTRMSVRAPDASYAQQRWTLDHPEDYIFVYNVFRLLGGERAPWMELARLVQERQDLLGINASRVDTARLRSSILLADPEAHR
ncbi:spore coat polysaccharide biosynthesis protein SpsF [Ciceribacter lividus]|uniref:Spore coat polysaccharide biosynthesis protein SpsF n=1 Tax=Ciceribacter lividus TaxID=1197950 RepID=A0A6I7HK70_9HYPH|nr:glycosyltransferase family protein [Ciceribacter lividus]RCW22489.1 spore coat polysaccharide biosynthesis protein SpsF [Ciceribacter lividus]